MEQQYKGVKILSSELLSNESRQMYGDVQCESYKNFIIGPEIWSILIQW